MTEGKDYILQVRVKNGPMLRAMRSSGVYNAAELSRLSGVSNTEVGKYLNLGRSPLDRQGNWNKSISKIAEALGTMPEDLFPPQHLHEVLKTNKGEVEASLDDIQAFIGLASDGTPETHMLETEDTEFLRTAVESLSPRYAKVLALRFGLDGPPVSFEEVGREVGCSQERARQISEVALRHMRGKIRVRNTVVNVEAEGG